jgi:hypothetical protein
MWSLSRTDQGNVVLEMVGAPLSSRLGHDNANPELILMRQARHGTVCQMIDSKYDQSLSIIA